MLYRILLAYALAKGFLRGLRRPRRVAGMLTTPDVLRRYGATLSDQRRYDDRAHVRTVAYYRVVAALPVNEPDSAWTAGRS